MNMYFFSLDLREKKTIKFDEYYFNTCINVNVDFNYRALVIIPVFYSIIKFYSN